MYRAAMEREAEKLKITNEVEDNHFKIWEELEEIPAVDSALQLYEKTKQICSATEVGFSALEWGWNFLAESLHIKRLAGSNIDAVVGDKIADLKDSYPLLQKRPEKIIRKTRQRSMRYVKKKTRSAFNNFLGKFLIFGLDFMLWMTEGPMQLLEPRSTSTSEKHVQTSPISKESSKGQLLEEKSRGKIWVDKISDEEKSILELIRRFLLFPMSVFICFLKETKSFINGSKHHKATSSASRRSTRNVTSRTMSPEKLDEIYSRRKVSPKKRLPPSSLWGNVKNAAFRLFGIPTSHVKQTDIRRFLTCSKHKSLNECSLLTCEQKKRKHPDFSDDSEDDLTNLDLDNYLSEDDPDYEPTDEDSTDETIDSEEEVSEGELEVESTKEGGFKMLKEKTTKDKSEEKVQMSKDKSDLNKISDEKQGEKTSDLKKMDSNKTDKSVLKPSFEITETDTSISKTKEKTDPVPQTKPVEENPKPAQKIAIASVAPMQPEKPSQRPPSTSSTPPQQMMSPHGNKKNKHGKFGGGPKTISSPSCHVIKQHSCNPQENKENTETTTSKELSKQGGGKSVSFAKVAQEPMKIHNTFI
ncbi:proteoglycan 4-like [Saccostrea echinata]|uniref:proteoglycan 4-like n=1 Tax=Saccostrea echinata TaxID=191078 RepID=UPI002A80FE45|nr:proteoglycan 4-like [Saccostrea echinata]